MIQATSGRRFEEKAQDELLELDGIQRYVYSLICTASSLRHYLTKREVILATGDASSTALEALDRLVARHLVLANPPQYRYKARHRVVASVVVECLQTRSELGEVIKGLAFAAASGVSSTERRQSRAWRLVVRILNHAFLLRVLGITEARRVYEEVESLLNFDYHYWLQRGSLEVERGDVRLAENFLNQAKSLAPDDYRVETEYAYMLIRRAWETPGHPEAQDVLEEGIEALESVISVRGDEDPYPYHVLGSQGLAWARRSELGTNERRRFLERLLDQVENGAKKHPMRRELTQLKDDLKKEVLLTAVPGT